MTPLLLGHRGNPAEHPENTLPGFLSAIECGADGVELDVQLTCDGVPVVIHDATLDRTTARSGRVDALTWQELDALQTGVPRLDTVLHALREHHVAVELKPSHTAAPDLARTVRDVARDAQAHRITLLSFDHAHDCVPLFRERPSQALATGRLAVWWEHVDEALCRTAEVIAWTVDADPDARRLARMGVAAIISNRPCAIARALREA